MDKFTEKAILNKEIAEKFKEQMEILNGKNYNNITPYIIINQAVKDPEIKAWLKQDVVNRQLILINAGIFGYDVE